MTRNRYLTIKQRYVPALLPFWPPGAKAMPITATFMLCTPGSSTLSHMAGPLETKVNAQARGKGGGAPIYRIEGGLGLLGDTWCLSMHELDVRPGPDGKPVVVVQVVKKPEVQQQAVTPQQLPSAAAPSAMAAPDDDHSNNFLQFQDQTSQERQQALPPLHSVLHLTGLPLLPALRQPHDSAEAMETDEADEAEAAADAAAVLCSLSCLRPSSHGCAPQPALSAADCADGGSSAMANAWPADTMMADCQHGHDRDQQTGNDQLHKGAGCNGNRGMAHAGGTSSQQCPEQQAPALQPPVLPQSQLDVLTEGTALMLNGTACSFYLGDLITTGNLCALHEARFPDTGQICFVKLYQCPPVQQPSQNHENQQQQQQQEQEQEGPMCADALQQVLQQAMQEEEGTMLWLARMKDSCRHIVRCLGTAEVAGLHGLLLERAHSLAHFSQRCHMSEGMVRRALAHTATALAHLHAQGMHHGQIRACNILWREQMAEACLAGFSSVFTLDDSRRRRSSSSSSRSSEASDMLPVASRAFSAPEVVQGAPLDQHADVWALACTALELLTRMQPPFYTLPSTSCGVIVVEAQQWVASQRAALSPNAFDFVRACLVGAEQRPTAACLLDMPFLKGPM